MVIKQPMRCWKMRCWNIRRCWWRRRPTPPWPTVIPVESIDELITSLSQEEGVGATYALNYTPINANDFSSVNIYSNDPWIASCSWSTDWNWVLSISVQCVAEWQTTIVGTRDGYVFFELSVTVTPSGPTIIPVESIDSLSGSFNGMEWDSTICTVNYTPTNANYFGSVYTYSNDPWIATCYWTTDWNWTIIITIYCISEWTTTLTGTIDDVPFFNYNVVVDPAPQPEPFVPENSILVTPLRWNARVQFFTSNPEEWNYIQANLDNEWHLNEFEYFWECDNQVFYNFMSEDMITMLGDMIELSGHAWQLQFNQESWGVIESYFENPEEVSIESVVEELDPMTEGGWFIEDYFRITWLSEESVTIWWTWTVMFYYTPSDANIEWKVSFEFPEWVRVSLSWNYSDWEGYIDIIWDVVWEYQGWVRDWFNQYSLFIEVIEDEPEISIEMISWENVFLWEPIEFDIVWWNYDRVWFNDVSGCLDTASATWEEWPGSWRLSIPTMYAWEATIDFYDLEDPGIGYGSFSVSIEEEPLPAFYIDCDNASVLANVWYDEWATWDERVTLREAINDSLVELIDGIEMETVSGHNIINLDGRPDGAIIVHNPAYEPPEWYTNATIRLVFWFDEGEYGIWEGDTYTQLTQWLSYQYNWPTELTISGGSTSVAASLEWIDPCEDDPCSDPECPNYDPSECDPCSDPCNPECPEYDPCVCDPCSWECPERDPCECDWECSPSIEMISSDTISYWDNAIFSVYWWDFDSVGFNANPFWVLDTASATWTEWAEGWWDIIIPTSWPWETTITFFNPEDPETTYWDFTITVEESAQQEWAICETCGGSWLVEYEYTDRIPCETCGWYWYIQWSTVPQAYIDADHSTVTNYDWSTTNLSDYCDEHPDGLGRNSIVIPWNENWWNYPEDGEGNQITHIIPIVWSRWLDVAPDTIPYEGWAWESWESSRWIILSIYWQCDRIKYQSVYWTNPNPDPEEPCEGECVYTETDSGTINWSGALEVCWLDGIASPWINHDWWDGAIYLTTSDWEGTNSFISMQWRITVMDPEPEPDPCEDPCSPSCPDRAPCECDPCDPECPDRDPCECDWECWEEYETMACPGCGGSWEMVSDEPCDACGGTWTIMCATCGGAGTFTCPDCGWTGHPSSWWEDNNSWWENSSWWELSWPWMPWHITGPNIDAGSDSWCTTCWWSWTITCDECGWAWNLWMCESCGWAWVMPNTYPCDQCNWAWEVAICPDCWWEPGNSECPICWGSWYFPLQWV